MFETFEETPLGGILLTAQQFRADTRENKIDLGLGVYRNEVGETIVLPSVKAAEQRLLAEQKSKTYIGLAGDEGFNRLIAQLVLDDALEIERTTLLQTPGGGAALRLLFEAVQISNPDATVWVPGPTWGNHKPILNQVGLKYAEYPYYDAATGRVDIEAMSATLESIPVGDVVLLHGCCHNPSGANLTDEQWDRIAVIAANRGWLPCVDLAYQGFAEGMQEDAYGVRKLYAAVPEMILAASCSKNFGIYRERTGLALATSADAKIARRTRSKLLHLARVSYSMPPDHGAAVVRYILTDSTLKTQWEDEVTEMRNRINQLRARLSETLAEVTGEDHFDRLGEHRGMFSLLGISPAQVGRLRQEHAIYMGDDSRINIAGLNDNNIPRFAQAVASVLDQT